MTKDEAISKRFNAREEINKVLAIYNDATKKIAEQKGIPQRYVQHGMGSSVNYPTVGSVAAIDWDVYGTSDDDDDDEEYDDYEDEEDEEE